MTNMSISMYIYICTCTLYKWWSNRNNTCTRYVQWERSKSIACSSHDAFKAWNCDRVREDCVIIDCHAHITSKPSFITKWPHFTMTPQYVPTLSSDAVSIPSLNATVALSSARFKIHVCHHGHISISIPLVTCWLHNFQCTNKDSWFFLHLKIIYFLLDYGLGLSNAFNSSVVSKYSPWHTGLQ